MFFISLLSLFIYIYAFIFGACIASFFHVIINRLPAGISIIHGRSQCDHCHHPLNALDLIPILSWLGLKGRCRYCGAEISVTQPLFEIFGGLMAVLCFHHYRLSMMTLISFILVMLLSAISVIDIKLMIIPDSLNIAVSVIALMTIPFIKMSLITRLAGMALYSLLMILMNCVHHESFGGGDIKLVIPLGFLLGMENMLVCLVLSVLSGAGYALYRLFREHDGLKGSIPFGPFIAASALIALLYGDMLFPLYLSFARF